MILWKVDCVEGEFVLCGHAYTTCMCVCVYEAVFFGQSSY